MKTDWPVAGAAIVFGIGSAVAGIVLWKQVTVPVKAASVPDTKPAVSFNTNKAFAEFRMRQLGLPIVSTYPMREVSK